MPEKPKASPTIPSIKPEQDEVASYRRSARSEAPRQSNFNGLLVFVIVLMAIMMGIGGYTLFEVQKQLTQSNALLAQGQENIEQLDSRLAATGTDVSKTLQDLQAQVQTNFSEIDKLWKVSYRQNRPDIQQNVRAITELKDDLGARIVAMDNRVKQMSTESQAILDEVTALREQELDTEIALLRGDVQKQADTQMAFDRRVNELRKDLQEIEADIRSINEHRAQLARDILQIRNQAQAPAPAVQ